MKRPLIQHGAEQHHDVTRELFLSVPAGGLIAGEIAEFEGVAGNPNADEPFVWWLIKVGALPGGFVSFTKCEAVWYGEDAAGNMYWELSASYTAVGEAVPARSDAPGPGATATGGARVLNVQEPANALTLAGLASGDYLILLFGRTGSNVLDTLNDTMYLTGLLFTYVAAQ